MCTSEQGSGRGEDVWNVAEEQGSKAEQLEPKVKCRMFGRHLDAAAQNTDVTAVSSSTQPPSTDK